jgi:hypothetical protein
MLLAVVESYFRNVRRMMAYMDPKTSIRIVLSGGRGLWGSLSIWLAVYPCFLTHGHRRGRPSGRTRNDKVEGKGYRWRVEQGREGGVRRELSEVKRGWYGEYLQSVTIPNISTIQISSSSPSFVLSPGSSGPVSLFKLIYLYLTNPSSPLEQQDEQNRAKDLIHI